MWPCHNSQPRQQREVRRYSELSTGLRPFVTRLTTYVYIHTSLSMIVVQDGVAVVPGNRRPVAAVARRPALAALRSAGRPAPQRRADFVRTRPAFPGFSLAGLISKAVHYCNCTTVHGRRNFSWSKGHFSFSSDLYYFRPQQAVASTS